MRRHLLAAHPQKNRNILTANPLRHAAQHRKNRKIRTAIPILPAIPPLAVRLPRKKNKATTTPLLLVVQPLKNRNLNHPAVHHSKSNPKRSTVR